MASTTPSLNEIMLSPIQRTESSVALHLDVPRTTCGYHVNQVVQEISSPTVREVVGTVFEDLLRLLECLNLIERHLRKPDAAFETFALFEIIHDEARALVKFIDDEALTCEAMNEDVSETLDGIIFAINHDLHRIFDNLQGGAGSTAQVALGQLFRAHDLLTNCLQQSIISLGITLDRKLDGTKMFEDSDKRYRQSIQLCKDISILLRLIVACGGGRRKRSAFANLKARVEVFRNESLECLMYSDWPEFEGFCEKINSPRTSEQELESVLHQFRCYLETLLGQVKMRAVLAKVIPAEFGANHGKEHVARDSITVSV